MICFETKLIVTITARFREALPEGRVLKAGQEQSKAGCQRGLRRLVWRKTGEWRWLVRGLGL